MEENNVTNDEILSAINTFADHVEERFEKIDERFEKIETNVNHIQAAMVTKEYLDDKLADLRGDLVVLTRKEDAKVRSLIGLLKNKNVISEQEARNILTMEPFPMLQ